MTNHPYHSIPKDHEMRFLLMFMDEVRDFTESMEVFGTYEEQIKMLNEVLISLEEVCNGN